MGRKGREMKHIGRWLIGITATVLAVLVGVLIYMVTHPITPVITREDVVAALKEEAPVFDNGEIQIGIEAAYADAEITVDFGFYGDTVYEYQPKSGKIHMSTAGTLAFGADDIAFTKEVYSVKQGSSVISYTNDSQNTYGWVKTAGENEAAPALDLAALLSVYAAGEAGFTDTEDTYRLSVILQTDRLKEVIGGSKPLLDTGLEAIGASLDFSYYQALIELEAQKETHVIQKITVTVEEGLKSTFTAAGRELKEGTMTIVYRPVFEEEPSISLPKEVTDKARTLEEINVIDDIYEPENEIAVRGKYALYNEKATMAVGINKPSGLMLSYDDYYYMSFSDFELYFEIKYWIKEKKDIDGYADDYIASRLSAEGCGLTDRSLSGTLTVGDWQITYEVLDVVIAESDIREYIACADLGTDSVGDEWCLYVEIFEMPTNGRYSYTAESALTKAFRAAKK